MEKWNRAVLYGLSGLVFVLIGSGCSTTRLAKSSQRGLFQSATEPVALSGPVNLPHAAQAIEKSEKGFIWPLKQGSISSFFGMRKRHFHDGIDIQAPRGTPVYAAKSGVVIYSSRRIRGYGNMVVVKHTDNTATVYAHNKKNLVTKGKVVKQGELLAYVGATGHATGPHLHFEVRNDRVAEDPLLYLPGFRSAGEAHASARSNFRSPSSRRW